MKIHKSFIIFLFVVTLVAFIYSIPKINAYIIAIQNDLRFTDLRFGPYYTIPEGMNKQEETVYIIKMDNYEAIKKNLSWRLYYDEANWYFVEVDFETGELRKKSANALFFLA